MSRPPYVNGDEALAAESAAVRPRLAGVAYGLLGSVDEAEGVVQDAWSRLGGRSVRRSGTSWGGWWSQYRDSRRTYCVRRAYGARKYVGPWPPEPVADSPSRG
ncbi:hypothetical protein ACSDR0_40315 [Streptosporangium sp. G11]|uniref:hypothetical protein n=1 Tax=Streptosporangium sp. G11 TaxID=3436926 RepID=UPI003EB9C177